MRWALVLCLSSCSLVGARGPSAPPGSPCTDRYTLPVLDTAGTIAAGLVTAVAIAALAEPCSGTQACTDREQGGLIVGLPALAVTTVELVSAWTGYERVGACRDARRLSNQPVLNSQFRFTIHR